MSDKYNPDSLDSKITQVLLNQQNNTEKLDTCIRHITEHIAKDDKVHEKIDERIGALEGSKRYFLGIVAGVTMIGALVHYLLDLTSKH